MKKLPAYTALFILQFITAITCAPYSCEWGNTVYFFTGVGIMAVAFLLPLWQQQWKLPKRLMYGLLFLLLSVVLWCVWFMLLDFKILCKLF